VSIHFYDHIILYLILSYYTLSCSILSLQGDCVVEGELREMYVQWPFFREMIDLIAMTLSKTDYSISTNYEKQVR
jgi:phosphoenolpyruvate carboxylase